MYLYKKNVMYFCRRTIEIFANSVSEFNKSKVKNHLITTEKFLGNEFENTCQQQQKTCKLTKIAKLLLVSKNNLLYFVILKLLILIISFYYFFLVQLIFNLTFDNI